MSSPAPKSPTEQSEKNKKYDRQLRLWGDHGQTALENSQVCLLNATAVGTEILKALVLPGIGAFTIVDGKQIQQGDVESNFFLDHESCGKSRAQVATRLLLELNPDIRGDFIDEETEQLLDNNPDFFNNFSVVIGTSLTEKTLIRLSKKLWDLDIPLLYCSSIGFLGCIRVQIHEHAVVESHPDSQHPDLRLDKLFSGLVEHFDAIPLESLELKDHAHVPYLVILYKYLCKWRSMSGSVWPNNYKEKTILKNLINDGILKNEHQVPEDEENFEEAKRAVNSSLVKTFIPPNVLKIINDDSCLHLTAKSKPFWILARALKEFIDNEGAGALPLKGTLPDMTAETSRYISLQQIYRNQAAKDADCVFRRVQQLLHELNQPSETISEAETSLFCRNASNLHLIQGTCIADEYQGKNTNLQNMELEPPSNMEVYYIMLRALDRFYQEYNVFPGEHTHDVEPDIIKLKGCISKLLGEWGSGPLAKDDYVHEICRYGGCELHAVSAFIGGCAAQEAIKLITKQYIPVHNTFIYDGITSSTATFTF